jgi:hypothetical protein
LELKAAPIASIHHDPVRPMSAGHDGNVNVRMPRSSRG